MTVEADTPHPWIDLFLVRHTHTSPPCTCKEGSAKWGPLPCPRGLESLSKTNPFGSLPDGTLTPRCVVPSLSSQSEPHLKHIPPTHTPPTWASTGVQKPRGVSQAPRLEAGAPRICRVSPAPGLQRVRDPTPSHVFAGQGSEQGGGGRPNWTRLRDARPGWRRRSDGNKAQNS